MLERLAAWFLNTYVAEYVGNVVTDQLSIGLLKGAVELEKLPLKKDALKKLKLPFDIKSGYIGKLKLQIPVRYIKSQPWVIQIDQLYVVAGPAKPTPFDADEEERVKQAKKQAKLDSLEQQWKTEQQKSSNWWFWSPFSITFPSSVLENLQVIVNDVHIRYEDSDADPSRPFSVGVVIDNISAQSTDENWEPKFVSGGDKAQKLVDLSNFSIYFDTELLGDLEGQALVDAMLMKHGSVMSQLQPMMASTMMGLQQSAEFIVKPLSGQAKLTRNRSRNPLKISDGPRFHLETQLNEIPIVLSDHHYRTLVLLFDSFQLRMKAREFRRWKPTAKIKERPGEWWRFAIDVTLRKIRERNRRRSMKYTLQRAQQNVVYVMGYTQHLTQGAVSEDVQRKLKEIEYELKYEELAVLRKLAMDRVKRERDLAEAAKRTIQAESESEQTNQSFLQRWFPGWVSTTTTTSQATPATSASPGGTGETVGMSAEEDELLHELELDYESRDNLLLRDRIFLTLSFSLTGGSFQLVTTPRSLSESFLGPQPLVELRVRSLCFSADLRPRLRYASVDVSLGSLSVEDHSDSDSLFPTLVKPKGAEPAGSGDGSTGKRALFERQYTVIDPLDSSEDGSSLFGVKVIVEEANRQKLIQLRVHSKPLNIVYNPATVSRVKQFLSAPITGRWNRERSSQASIKLKNSLGGMLQADSIKASGYRLVSIKMDISAPHVILPEDFKNRQCSLVIVDLGHVTLSNVSDWSEENVKPSKPQLLQDIDDEEDDDDLFQTPLSSPPSEEELTDGAPLSQPAPPQLLQSALHSIANHQRLLNDPFERYLLSLSDLQILVGKAEDNWKEVTRSGQSSLHLLDRFTLSVRIQRMLEDVPDHSDPSLNLSANLPSLKFHIDEHKVHTLISCLRALKPVDAHPALGSPSSPSPMEASMYQSAYSDPDIETSPPSSSSQLLAASMYHSAFGTLPDDEQETTELSTSHLSSFNRLRLLSASVDSEEKSESSGSRDEREMENDLIADWEKLHQRAEMKVLSAQLSINEAVLTISSFGRTITEISVPGAKAEFLKRPYDSATRLLVQDLCIVDRIQTFGPEYELVVCSSGRSLLGFSPLDASPSSSSSKSAPSESFETRNHSCPNFSSLKSVDSTAKSTSGQASTSDVEFNDASSRRTLESISPDVFNLYSKEEMLGALCALTYTQVSPLSPEHPAMKDLERHEVCVEKLESEPNIHRINLQCTAIDAIANQETVVELVSFFQRSIPEELLSRRSAASVTPSSSQENDSTDHLDKTQNRSKYQLHTEVKVQFERLGIRLLRRKLSYKRDPPPPPPPPTAASLSSISSAARLVAKIMLYGLSVHGTVSSDVSIDGRLDGIQVTDLTPQSKKYANIVHVGIGGESTRSASVSTLGDDHGDQQALSFSISRSARPMTSLSGTTPPPSDVMLRLSVPSIHYTHSVNFVYEMEMFVSDLKFYSTKLTASMKSAAFGMAKGFVSKESHLAKGLGRLHSSFGYTSTRSNFSLSQPDETGGEVEENDGEIATKIPDKIFLKVSVQSPVIVLPSSLEQDKCLVAHLGKIVVENEFIPEDFFAENQTDINQSTSMPSFFVDGSSSEVERLSLTVSNISLHATQSKDGREWLESALSEELSSSPDSCFKVLKESSISLQIDKHFSKNSQDSMNDSDGLRDTSLLSEESTSDPTRANIVITGRICNSLLIILPKEVFDQIRSTLKHGIRRKPSSSLRRRKTPSTSRVVPHAFDSRQPKTVRFDSQVNKSKKYDGSVSMPKIYGSFTLPRLSLELQRMIDEKNRSVVYISFDDFSLRCQKLNAHITSFDVALKSIVIEDLLQPRDSEYRNILASSVKPLPFISPIPTPTKSLQRLSNASSLSMSLSRHLLPIMSTPKPQAVSESPLRSFDPSICSLRRDDLSTTVSGGSKIGNETTKNWSAMEETSQSTLRDESAANVSEARDLLTIKGKFVEKRCPVFASKYNSVSLHTSVDFSSVFVVINLQTWVLLFDFLGIGVPTPPPSRPSSAEPSEVGSRANLQPPPSLSLHPESATTRTNPDEFASALDESLLQDAIDFSSLGSGNDLQRSSSDQQTYSLYDEGKVTSSTTFVSAAPVISDIEVASIRSGTASSEATITSSSLGKNVPPTDSSGGFSGDGRGRSSVWGVEGKMSMEVTLNVKSLTVTFNKPEHPLARGSVSSLYARLQLNKGNVKVSGSLGQASVVDLTKTGAFYKERFTTTGEQALTFEVFKYGRPDPLMERPFDISGEVKMTSVRYLHTMRFLKEILAFLSHFPQLIDAFQRMKAHQRGNLEYFGPERKARISLDVDIEGPVLLIPKHAFSPDLMVGDIGHVKVTNSTRYDGQEGTIKYRREKDGLDQIKTITGSSSSPFSYGGADLSSPHLPPKLSPQSSVLSTISVSSSSLASQVIDRSGSYSHSCESFPTSHPTSTMPRLFELSNETEEEDNSIFGNFQNSIYSSVEEDRRRVEKQLEAFAGPCLLDCIEVSLSDVDVFSAKKVKVTGDTSYRIVRQPGKVLKEKGKAELYIERNLYEDFCRNVPDLHIEGMLEAIHALLDKPQLELIKGLIDMNLGEPIEEFEKPSTVIRDPIAQPMAADVWTGFLFRMRFVGVTLEFLQSRETDAVGSLTRSLARFDIQDSEFSFESRSDQCKTVDFTNHAVIGYDTRYEDDGAEQKASVFEEVLRPRFHSDASSKRKAIQVEIHVALTPKEIKASILLNKLRLIGIFDLIMELKSFVFDKIPENKGEDEDDVDGIVASSSAMAVTNDGLHAHQKMTSRPTKKPQEENKPPRTIEVKLSVTETDFVVVEDVTSLDSSAVVLKGTVVLKFTFVPNKEMNVKCSMEALELFSCNLSNEDESALSILDPVSVSLELKPAERVRQGSSSVKAAASEDVISQVFVVEVEQLNFRLSYNDIKLFLAIAQSLQNLESKEAKPDSLKRYEMEIKDAHIKKLLPLGFTREAIRRELFLSSGDLDTAASKLLDQQKREQQQMLQGEEVPSIITTNEGEGWDEVDSESIDEVIEEKDTNKKSFSVGSIAVSVRSLSVCLIDDCINRDVPLFNFSLSDFHAEHTLREKKSGRAKTNFAGDYYNRSISAWEPVVEPWNIELGWKIVKNYSTNLDSNNQPDRLSFSLSSKEQLCMNITSSLVQILKVTQESWRQDLQQRGSGDEMSVASTSSSLSSAALTHHRRTASGRVVFEEASNNGGSTHLTHHRRTSSGRVVFDEASSSTHFAHHHRRTPSGRVIYEEPGSSSPTNRTHHRRTSSGRVVLEDTAVGGEDSSKQVALSKMKQGLALLHSVRFVNEIRLRMKFVPFLLRNSTGLPLTFATLTSAPSKVYVSPSALYQKTKQGGRGMGVADELGRTSEWMSVSPGGEKPFDFNTKGKLRHRDTRSFVIHQLLVKVAGWQRISIPVSVDKIGVFFREVWPSSDCELDTLPELPADRRNVRLVFAISLSDTQKVVNVRSSLVLHNTMEIPLQVRLERATTMDKITSVDVATVKKNSGGEGRCSSSGGEFCRSVNLPSLSPRGYAAVPLHLMEWNIRVRPQDWGLQYCSKNLTWKHVVGKSSTSHTRACEAIGEGVEPPFRFCVNVQRENYPPDISGGVLPAHTLTLYPPLTVCNLLPCDIQFYLLGSKIRKFIKRGKEIAIYSVDSRKPIEFAVAMEAYQHCHGCVVSPDKVGLPLSLVVEDSTNGRPLRLSVTSEMLGGMALKVSISCSYWMINRTGLPLVFKQEGASCEAAGQLEEHERASTTTPLLFSYSEGELVEKCSMRLGRSYRNTSGQPIWCQPFEMISDCRVRRLFVRSTDGRPDLEYQIGVDVHRGRFQYQQTRVVTFVAHYQLENRTQFKLAYLQRHQLQNEERMSLNKKIPTIMPNALMAFHWPRVDLDKLLCLRVEDINDCQWSGGFPLDKDGAFHIHMRGNYGHSIFVRCEVALKRATYHIVLSDAANYPSPFRLENLSQISVSYCQSGGGRANVVSLLNPGQSVPYAWDEQTLPKKLCVQVKGSRESQELDFEMFGARGKLYYESYFYITAADTFPPKDESASSYHGPAVSPAHSLSLTHHRKSPHCGELVLDVPQGRAVIFRRRDPEKRTQLWRMAASRRLVHIESSTGSTNMVLDIEGGRLPSKGGCVSLVLQRESSSRLQSQAWRFTEDGRLLLDNTSYLCVQSKSGYEALREGSDVVLGHVTSGRGVVIPPEQKIVRLKHSPGSGVLSVSVVSDGPTRILRITDENKKYSHTSPHDDWVVGDSGQVTPSRSSDVDSCNDSGWDSDDEDTPSKELELSLILEQGVGISLINSVPEELLFASLTGIRVEFVSTVEQQCLNATIQYIQVDNKLTTSRYSVMAYPTPDTSGERTASYPVVRLFAEKVPHKSPFAIVFKLVELKLRNMTLLLEEKLLFKMLQWAGMGQAQHEAEVNEDKTMSMLTYRTAVPDSSRSGESKQLYFEEFQISDVELRVSMLTASQLPDDLKRIKRHLGIPLVMFESPILLDGFHQCHTLGSVGNFTSSLGKHYKQNVKSQAILILGSMDFLGNPLGLVSDVASGVSGMLTLQPDVLGLVRDVTHGVSDTTSKLTGTVSHVLGKATFDSSFQEEREQIVESAQSGRGYLTAGLMGFAGGVFSGITSIVTQPYKGAQESGIGGFLTGIPKGVVGTVTKPLAGLFDLASGTTAALRETTSRISRQHPPPVRHRRCCVGAGGALSIYSISQAKGLEYLLRLNDGNTREKFVSYELVYESTNQRDLMKVIISSQYLYFFQESPPDPSTLDNKISLDDLAECRAAVGKTSIPSVYIVLSLIDKQEQYTASKYKCTNEQKAKKIAQLVNYAKNLHEEEKHVVRTLRLQQGTIW